MMGITPQQSEVLAFIRQCQATGYTPSYREIGANTGRGLSKVKYIIDQLVERGRLRRLPGRVRALEVVKELPPLTTFSTNELLRELARRGVRP